MAKIGGKLYEAYQGVRQDGTNNIGELVAVSLGLKLVEKYHGRAPRGETKTIHILTDSRYTKRCVSGEDKPKTNQVYVRLVKTELDVWASRWKIRWWEVPAHTGVRLNVRADLLAKKGATVARDLQLQNLGLPHCFEYPNGIAPTEPPQMDPGVGDVDVDLGQGMDLDEEEDDVPELAQSPEPPEVNENVEQGEAPSLAALALRQLYAAGGAPRTLPRPPRLTRPPPPKGKVRCPLCAKCVRPKQLQDHAMNCHADDLKPTGARRAEIEEALRSLERHICDSCCKVSASSYDGLCRACDKKRPVEKDRIEETLTREEKEFFAERIRRRDETTLTTLKSVPKVLNRAYSACLTLTANRLANAKTDREELAARVDLASIKALLVRPRGGGGRKRRYRVKALTGKLCAKWEAGEFEDVWREAKDIEEKRRVARRKRRRRAQRLKKPPKKRDPRRQRLDTAAWHCQNGDNRRAVQAVTSHGVARPEEGDTLAQLRGQHQTRRHQVERPTREWVENERASYETDEKESTPELELSPELPEPGIPSPPIVRANDPDPEEKLTFSATVTAEEVLAAAKESVKGTTGGLDQLTPWILRRAIEASPGNRLAKVVARIANRTAAGHYSDLGGEIFGACRLIALYKDKNRKKVRPIGIGIGAALRRLIAKVLARAVRPRFNDLLADHNQLGVLKGGFEVGIHAMRELADQCVRTGEVVLVNDYANAFNSANRDLMLKLADAHLPELATAIRWLYKGEPDLVISGGGRGGAERITIKSSEGTQQGDPWANICFGLLAKYIDNKIDLPGVRVRKWFWDDSVLTGKLRAIVRGFLKMINMEGEVGLAVKLAKVSIYCPSSELAQECTRMLEQASVPIKDPDDPESEGVRVYDTMALKWMRVPVGPDDHVEEQLRTKLEELRDLVKELSDMPAKHEGFTILRSCSSHCKIVHLLRTLPPAQSIPFAREFDRVLRAGFESLVGYKLTDRWWRLVKLPIKYGGVGLRSGDTTAAAQYATSVMKTATDVERVAPGYSARAVLERDVVEELQRALTVDPKEPVTVDVDELIETEGRAKVENLDLSLAQRCEAAESERVLALMTQEEREHISAHSARTTQGGSDHAWLRVAPLHWKGFALGPKVWLAAMRRRLRLPVYSHASKPGGCTHCRVCTRDVWARTRSSVVVGEAPKLTRDTTRSPGWSPRPRSELAFR